MLVLIYYVGQEQDIALEGGLEPLIYIDTVGLTTQTYGMPDDTFSDGKLIAGETEIFPHNIAVLGGNWTINFAIDNSLWASPEQEFYGYSAEILDSEDNPITEMNINAGENKVFKIKHFLDGNFAHTMNLLPFDLDITLTETIFVYRTGVGCTFGTAQDEIVFAETTTENGILFRLDTDDLVTTIIEPTDKTEWTEVQDTSTNLLYNWVIASGDQRGIKAIGSTGGGMLFLQDTIVSNLDDYAVLSGCDMRNMKCLEGTTSFLVFHYEDINNFYKVGLRKSGFAFCIQVEDGKETEIWNTSFTVVSMQHYDTQVEIDPLANTGEFYVDNDEVPLGTFNL